jgi:hypothetical protein
MIQTKTHFEQVPLELVKKIIAGHAGQDEPSVEPILKPKVPKRATEPWARSERRNYKS